MPWCHVPRCPCPMVPCHSAGAEEASLGRQLPSWPCAVHGRARAACLMGTGAPPGAVQVTCALSTPACRLLCGACSMQAATCRSHVPFEYACPRAAYGAILSALRAPLKASRAVPAWRRSGRLPVQACPSALRAFLTAPCTPLTADARCGGPCASPTCMRSHMPRRYNSGRLSFPHSSGGSAGAGEAAANRRSSMTPSAPSLRAPVSDNAGRQEQGPPRSCTISLSAFQPGGWGSLCFCALRAAARILTPAHPSAPSTFLRARRCSGSTKDPVMRRLGVGAPNAGCACVRACVQYRLRTWLGCVCVARVL